MTNKLRDLFLKTLNEHFQTSLARPNLTSISVEQISIEADWTWCQIFISDQKKCLLIIDDKLFEEKQVPLFANLITQLYPLYQNFFDGDGKTFKLFVKDGKLDWAEII
jgi:hypothetical protein